MSEEVEWAATVSEGGGVANGFGDEVFSAADGFDGIVSEDEVAEERGGEGAAGAMGGGGFEVFTGEPVEIAGGQAEEIGGLRVVSGGSDDVEVGVSGG